MSDPIESVLLPAPAPAPRQGPAPVLHTQASSSAGKQSPNSGKPLPPAVGKSSSANLEKIVEKLNRVNASIGRELRFQVAPDGGRTVIQVLDRDTGEIIRQIPPEKVEPYVKLDGELEVRLFDDLV